MSLSRNSVLVLAFSALVAASVGSARGGVETPSGLSPAEWSDIQASVEAARHAACPVDGGYRAHNPGQRFATQFDGRGFTTRPDEGGWSWGLELVSYGTANSECDVTGAAPVSADGSRVSYAWDSRLTEWYVNDGRGLEHGYTVAEAPASDVASDGRATDSLCLTLAVRGGLRPQIDTNGRDVRFVAEDGAGVISYHGLTVFDADGRSVPARFESVDRGIRLIVDDREARYPLTIDPIAEKAYLKASNTQNDDRFGYSVSIASDTVVVGAPYEDSAATTVDGNGADNAAHDAGAAYVFVKNGATWSQQAYLKASNAGANDRFGWNVAVAGDTVIVGAPQESSNSKVVNGDGNNDLASRSGAAYVFTRSGSTWSQQAYLKASNATNNDTFGSAVAIVNDTAVIGAPTKTLTAYQTGATYVFVRSGSSWSEQAFLKITNGGTNDAFGSSVSVFGDTLVSGAPGEDSSATGVNGDENNDLASGSGAAYVLVRSGSTWSQQAYLKASNTGGLDHFGFAVTIDSNTIAVGAPDEDSNAKGINGDGANNTAPGSGAAYVFLRSGSTWAQQAYLKPSNTGDEDFFGNSVSVSGNSLVVGAQYEDSQAIGVNGNGLDDGAADSGAAYVFARSGVTWTQSAYLKASNTDSLDGFGNALAVAGDRIVVAAAFESSSATGVNGNQASNTASRSGAVYVFDSTLSNFAMEWVEEFPEATPSIFRRFATTNKTTKYNITPEFDIKEYAINVTDGASAPLTPVQLKVTVKGSATGTGHEPHLAKQSSTGIWFHGWLFDTEDPLKLVELKNELKLKVFQFKTAGGSIGITVPGIANPIVSTTLGLSSNVVGRASVIIKTDSAGVARFRYVPSELSGTDTIDVSMIDSGAGPVPSPLTTSIQVQRTGLVELETSSDGSWVFENKAPTVHSDTHFGKPELLDGLRDVAAEYKSLQQTDTNLGNLKTQLNALGYTLPTQVVHIHDMSLPLGGLADFDGDGASPHGGHRTGINAEIQSNHLVLDVKNPDNTGVGDPMVMDVEKTKLIKKAHSRQYKLLEQSFKKKNFTVLLEGSFITVTLK